MKVIILSAGLGTRLWPLSTADNPKQFQTLINEQSLLSYTYGLLNKIFEKKDIYVQTLSGLERLVAEQIPSIESSNIITVPEHRDTLAETLWAINQLSPNGNEPILFKSVDQYITETEDFLKMVNDSLVSFNSQSIKAITLLGTKFQSYSPNSGYITADGPNITAFVEKPSESYVNQLLKKGTLYRSLFMFIASRDLFLGALDESSFSWTSDAKHLLLAKNKVEAETYFKNMPIIDISSTIFQSTKDLKIYSVGDSNDFRDVGRYSALYEINQKDERGNVVIGEVKLGEACTNNLIINSSDQPLKVTGANNMVIVQSPRGSFVANIRSADKVKNI